MPTCLSINPATHYKKCKLTLLLLISPLFFYGQSLTGLWTGILSNDSNTVRKDQLFEIALTEYKGKVYGYSRSEFIVDDVLYYTVKRVKGTIEGDICEVIDDEIVSYNFPGKIDKGIKVTSTFKRNKSDSTWELVGTWKTNATKKYYSISGKVDLSEEKDLTTSKIFPHLEELKMANEVVFYKDRKEGLPLVKIAKPERIKTEYKLPRDLSPAAPEKISVAGTDLQKNIENPAAIEAVAINTGPSVADAVLEEKEEDVAVTKRKVENAEARDISKVPTANIDINSTEKNDIKAPVVKTIPKQNIPVVTEIKTQPVATTEIKSRPVEEKITTPAVTSPVITDIKKPAVAVANKEPEQKKPAPEQVKTTVKTEPTATKKEPAVVKTEPVVAKTEPKIANKPIEELIQKSAVIAGRKSEFSQEVNFKSDSLELALYDNGEIDGDTMSVLLNGEMLMFKQGLKASAIKKTIYIKPGEENFTLVLFADNLGKYPPNTGLLIVHDGEDIYHLRFSSDFQKSSGIVFRRKK